MVVEFQKRAGAPKVKVVTEEQYRKMVDALQTVNEMFEQKPELKEIDAAWPRGSVYGIVRRAL